MTTGAPGQEAQNRVRRALGHLCAAGDELLVRSAHDAYRWIARTRARKVTAVALLAAVVLVLATTRFTITGHFIGLFLLENPSGRPLELKDDLRLGDGSRLIWGASFTPIHEILESDEQVPRLERSWDEAQGSGSVTNLLPGGARLETYFGRYVQDDGKTPGGLFVGGALADVAASMNQNQSGMAIHDARGWHHVWCNVNEVYQLDETPQPLYPGDWTFRGSKVLVDGDERIVLESEHELRAGLAHLRMNRFAYFKAGQRFFSLGINMVNVGKLPVTISYLYGDDPWVGTFGSAEGNIGWAERGLVQFVMSVDPHRSRWGGILDTKTGLANFISWDRNVPDLVYFANHPRTPLPPEVGNALGGNEIFIGLEWRKRLLQPGETLPIRLNIGVADPGPGGVPTAPAGAASSR